MRSQGGFDFATRRQVLDEVASSLPIHDLMAWMIQTFTKADRDQIFAAFKWVYEAGFKIGSASSQPRSYRIAGQGFNACPQRIEVE